MREAWRYPPPEGSPLYQRRRTLSLQEDQAAAAAARGATDGATEAAILGRSGSAAAQLAHTASRVLEEEVSCSRLGAGYFSKFCVSQAN